MAFDWSSLIGPAVSTGVSLYDMYNKNQIAGDMQGVSVSPAVDAFGADERQYYQDRMRSIYNDPSQLENTPGYQFSLQQGTKGVNREAAKMGHFRGTNRLYDLAEFQQGLASQTYNTEMDRLAGLSGSKIAPDAGAFQKLYSEGAGMKAAQGEQAQDAWGGVLKDFSEALGGDSSGGATDVIKEALGGDTSSIPSDVAPELEAASELGPEAYERASALGDYSEAGGNADLGGPAMGQLFADKKFFGDALANSRTSDIAGETFGTTGSEFGVGGMGNIGTGMASAGGVLGGMAATKLTGSTGGGVHATNAIGGTMGSVAGGAAAGAMGVTSGAASGAAGGAAAGGALAGPAIPLALAMMAYGGYSEHQGERRRVKDTVGQLFGNTSSELTDFGKAASYQGHEMPYNVTGGHKWTSPDGEDYYIGATDYASFAHGQGQIGKEFNLYDAGGEFQGRWDNVAAKRTDAANAIAGDKGYAETALQSKIQQGNLDTTTRQRLYESPQPTNPAPWQPTVAPAQAGGNTGSYQVGDTTYTPESPIGGSLWGASGYQSQGN